MKKILYYLVPLATAFLLCGCLKDMKDGELLHGNREVLISIDLPGELASLDKSGFKVTMRNTKIGNTYTSETDAKGETRIDAEYGNYSVIISKVADVGGISKFLHATRDFVLNKDGQSAGTNNLEIKATARGTIILKEGYFHKTKMHANQFNNHLFAISPEGAYMWASDYRIAFVYTYLDNILLYDKVMLAEDNAWGPAHEIGHVHQLAIDWMGSTESSNNLFSNYIIYQLGKYKSRGRGLDYLAECVYGQNQAWYNMGSATHQGEDTEIHMRMNWQLWLYYELCKGHDKKPMVWPKIFELMRTTYQHVPTHQPGQRQMAFVKAVCDATQEDLTEFFETWGFFKAVDAPIEQYGQAQYTVTEQMICETKAYIQNKKYPKAAPIQYIEDRKRDFFPSSDPRAQESGDVGYYEVFKNHTKISKVPTYTLSSSHQGATIRVSDGEEAVAFEVRENEANSRLLYFSNSFTFTVPSKVYQSSAKVYAVQADGQRILLTAR